MTRLNTKTKIHATFFHLAKLFVFQRIQGFLKFVSFVRYLFRDLCMLFVYSWYFSFKKKPFLTTPLDLTVWGPISYILQLKFLRGSTFGSSLWKKSISPIRLIIYQLKEHEKGFHTSYRFFLKNAPLPRYAFPKLVILAFPYKTRCPLRRNCNGK